MSERFIVTLSLFSNAWRYKKPALIYSNNETLSISKVFL